jgi:hypothetical protein
MLFGEAIAVYGESHTYRPITLREQNAALIMLKLVVHIETAEFKGLMLDIIP